MALPTGVGYDIIEIKNIIRCKSDNNYTYFYFHDGRRILVSRTLKEIEALLRDQGFFRIHQSHLVNAKFVKNISRQDGGLLVMIDGAEVPVSRQKKGQIKEILESMLRFK
jgi:two-component system LytT family response regulator